MKKGFLICLALFYFCSVKQTTKYGIGKKDKEYDFFSSISRTRFNTSCIFFIEGDIYGYSAINSLSYIWLKKTENLKSLYKSMKIIGIDKFISKEEFNRPLFNGSEHISLKDKSLNQLTKKLIDNYNGTNKEEYFTKFWLRRKQDKNDSIVYQILKDASCFYNSKKCAYPEIVNWKSNKKIQKLFYFDYQLTQLKNTGKLKIVVDYFNYLEKLELYTSAHNLITYTINNYKLDSVTKNELLILKNKNNTKKGDYSEYEYWSEFSAKWIKPEPRKSS